MVKTKAVAIIASAALVATLGLSACGGQTPSGSTSSSSSSSSTTNSNTASANTNTSANSNTSNKSTSSSSSKASNEIVSWEGITEDGTLVSYMSSDDGTLGAISLSQMDSNVTKSWMGDMVLDSSGKVTITDETTKDTISFTVTDITKDGAAEITLEDHGKGILAALTEKDYKKLEEFQQTLAGMEVLAWGGALDDGTLVSYMTSDDEKHAALAITPSNSSKKEETWMGSATMDADGKVTITDDTTKDTISFTINKVTVNKKTLDTAVEITLDGYGKTKLVAFTANDYNKFAKLFK